MPLDTQRCEFNQCLFVTHCRRSRREFAFEPLWAFGRSANLASMNKHCLLITLSVVMLVLVPMFYSRMFIHGDPVEAR